MAQKGSSVKAGTKKEARKGDAYTCEVCGLVVTVDEDCGCETCDLICCETQMKPVKKKRK